MFKSVLFTWALLFTCLISCVPAEKNDQLIEKDIDIKDEQNENDNTVLELPKESLQKFDKNQSVEALNEFLYSLGYDVDISDEFNTLTTWALTDIQLQKTPNYATGMYDEITMATLNVLKDKKDTISIEAGLKKPKHPESLTQITENPYDILSIINKEYRLPFDYVPRDLVVPDIRFTFTEDDPKKQLRKVAANAIEDLFKQADQAGLTIYAQSGYRSYARQKVIFESNLARHGEKHANTYSARPGESEHQMGLAMDVTTESVNFDLNTDFGNTQEGKWLKDHAKDYGFIIRYPEDKVSITKYQYEPWHIRYVGINLAKKLHDNQETLEEYYKKNYE